jgi:radical SAM superfamily enzyme YgiQ (UPF0313 family)
MYIASSLKQANKSHEVKIIDMVVERKVYHDIRNEIKEFQPDIVGISGLTPEADAVHFLADSIKKDCAHCAIIVGGPYGTSAPRRAVMNPHIDFAVIGEGERTMVELTELISNHGHTRHDFRDTKGIAYLRDGDYIQTEPREYLEDLDSLPFPAWEMIPMEKYFSLGVVSESKTHYHQRYMSIFTSRGCPYGCIYCHNIFGKRFRCRSAENVFLEIKTLYEQYNFHEIHFLDDTFNLNRKRVLQLCRSLQESGFRIKFSFPNGLRGDILDEEIIDVLAEAGMYSLALGIESGSEKIQRSIKKNADLHQLKKSIAYLHHKGIATHGFFMVGFPGETGEDIQQTIAFAKESQLHTAGFHSLIPFEGTPLYQQVTAQGSEIKLDSTSHNFKKLDINLSSISASEIAKLIKRAYWDFYANPKRLWNIFKLSPNKMYLFQLITLYILLDRRLFKLRNPFKKT